MNRIELAEIIAQALRTHPTAILSGTRLDRISGWNSIQHVDLICTLEETFGVELNDADAARIIDLDSALQALAGRTVRASDTDIGGQAERKPVPEIMGLPIPDQGVVLVHSSVGNLKSFEHTAFDLLEALTDRIVGLSGGTLAMPSMTLADDLSRQGRHAVSRATGLLPELLRRTHAARRSSHPIASFVAVGPMADQIVRDHPLDRPEGPEGPLGKLHQLDAHILLLGVDFEAVTAIHMAEYLEEVPYIGKKALPAQCHQTDGSQYYVGIGGCPDATFRSVQEHMQGAGQIAYFPLLGSRSALFKMRDAVASAQSILKRDRFAFCCGKPGCSYCAEKATAKYLQE